MKQNDHVKINNPDIIWNKLMKLEGDVDFLSKNLLEALNNNIHNSKLDVMLQYIDKMIKGNKSARILDFGCGGGQLVTYLRLMGYKNITGIDIHNQTTTDKLNLLHKNIGFKDKDVFFRYDGNTLPFEEFSFDFIISQQVIEHVSNVENYFFECYRVLSNGGRMLIDFPQRLMPYDSHTRMWFVHYFPKKIRNMFYDRYRSSKTRKGSDYYNNLLYLRTAWFYKKILHKVFRNVQDCTTERITSFNYRDVYEGNTFLRYLAHWIMKIPVISLPAKFLFSQVSISTFIVTK